MDKKISLLLLIPLMIGGVSCNLPDSANLAEEQVVQPADAVQSDHSTAEDYPNAIPSTGNLIQPEDFFYLGYFRLPEPSGGSDWDYSGHGLTYYPDGDPEGAADGFPGSLYGFGHDHQLYVSEISIPEPVFTSSLAEANTAGTLQPFADITGGIFNTTEMTIPQIRNPGSILHLHSISRILKYPMGGRVWISLTQRRREPGYLMVSQTTLLMIIYLRFPVHGQS